eukprot:TRINITY_DN58514_c0_g1_i1.p1 TRINITY_DN58514_c0_g1~~TRINITY_DN58514_c0_g1_i1.p1  ORF type:complete len:183 (-),score=38.19 TRINITY_DN58514_c0_g1_i1:319-819(-)
MAVLANLAGRWVAQVDDDKNQSFLVIVSADGGVVFVDDEEGAGSLRFVPRQDAECDDPGFVLQAADGASMGMAAQRTQANGDIELKVQGQDGATETWRRVADADGTPRFVQRKNQALPRRWTREDQIGSPKHVGRVKQPNWETPFHLDGSAPLVAQDGVTLDGSDA